jgi:RNA polymerase sigma factor (sigma-70 family)
MAAAEAFESILAAAQTGAEWAFEKLYIEFNPRLERYFGARAPAVRDDLTAETWISVAGTLRAFRGDERQFRSWLFTIAYRRLVDHWKQAASAPEPVDPFSMTGRGGDDDPEVAVVESMSAQEAARRIVACLPPDQGDVILLRVLGDLDVEQVAEILGKRPGAVRALQHRALKTLKKEISLEAVTE